MTRRYYFTYSYERNNVTTTVKNPYLFETKEEAYEHLGKSISELVTYNVSGPIVITSAKVSYEYLEEV